MFDLKKQKDQIGDLIGQTASRKVKQLLEKLWSIFEKKKKTSLKLFLKILLVNVTFDIIFYFMAIYEKIRFFYFLKIHYLLVFKL